MPLPRGYSRAAISDKIRMLHEENRGRRKKRSNAQIVAIALNEARREAERRGAHPTWLRPASGGMRRRRARHRRTR